MIEHLEAYGCSCGKGRKDLRMYALTYDSERLFTRDKSEFGTYKCPTCSANFSDFFQLVRHVELSTCTQGFDDGIGYFLFHLHDRLGGGH